MSKHAGPFSADRRQKTVYQTLAGYASRLRWLMVALLMALAVAPPAEARSPRYARPAVEVNLDVLERWRGSASSTGTLQRKRPPSPTYRSDDRRPTASDRYARKPLPPYRAAPAEQVPFEESAPLEPVHAAKPQPVRDLPDRLSGDDEPVAEDIAAPLTHPWTEAPLPPSGKPEAPSEMRLSDTPLQPEKEITVTRGEPEPAALAEPEIPARLADAGSAPSLPERTTNAADKTKAEEDEWASFFDEPAGLEEPSPAAPKEPAKKPEEATKPASVTMPKTIEAPKTEAPPMDIDKLLDDQEAISDVPPLPVPGTAPAGEAPASKDAAPAGGLPPLPELAELPPDPNAPPSMDDILPAPKDEALDLSFLDAPAAEDPLKDLRPEPQAPAGEVTLTLPFGATETEVSLASKEKLAPLLEQLKASPELRLQIIAYAEGSKEQAADARKASLARALSVKNHLQDKGISGDRLIVQAMGNRFDKGPGDRVDLVVK